MARIEALCTFLPIVTTDLLRLSVSYPPFIDPANPTVSRVADHIEHIATVTGRDHVGIASDFEGMYSSVRGLEDASCYPNLVSLANCPIFKLIAKDCRVHLSWLVRQGGRRLDRW